MSLASHHTPSRSALLALAAAVCAAIALVLAVGTHRSSARDGNPGQEQHGWVHGLFANNELHDPSR